VLVSFVVLTSLAASEGVAEAEPERASPFGATVPARGQPVFGVVAQTYANDSLELLVAAQASIGVGAGIDLGAKVEHSVLPLLGPGSLMVAHVIGRKALWDTGKAPDRPRFRTTFSADVSAAWAADAQPGGAQTDARRWLGLRDYNAELGCTFATDWLFDLYAKTSVLMSLDTSPISPGPLSGPPPRYDLGAVFALELGYQLRFKEVLAVVGIRLMGHTRADDEAFSCVTFIGVGFG
jgi:hypothetical protein